MAWPEIIRMEEFNHMFKNIPETGRLMNMTVLPSDIFTLSKKVLWDNASFPVRPTADKYSADDPV